MRYGATILDAEGLRLSAEEKTFFAEANPFGFILFARNIESADQTRALCDDLRAAVGRDCLITIDQEGGRVQRLRPPLARQWRPALDHATAAGQGANRAMYLRARLIADELRGLGIDSNCAPLADVAGPDTHAFLQNRCYGTDLTTVVTRARATAEGLLDGGVVPVVKHIPGHGRASLDSHKDLPRITAPLADLAGEDFAAFAALNHLPMGMTAHLVYDALDTQPATLSARVMQMIRSDIGFDGLIMSDDISMKALSGTPQDIARDTLAAGCDVVLFCNAPLDERRAVAAVAGEMTDAAQARAERAEAARRNPAPLDIPAAEAELSALMGGQVYG
ncbi:beta-N-acetylhexosaminidase [Phaeobacter porticola]|uniref:beta-N-acetylhexosaminidase n=1 Tax=Phaeobacter porticola TaxID=1844006 RepID=A0A1L3I345_9RHOB|nr:beta-N-acetylhexosaminidase [Phaeobacter porticola]APG46538.1 putative beta-hexosaminidase [Phaeobacter porticola]